MKLRSLLTEIKDEHRFLSDAKNGTIFPDIEGGEYGDNYLWRGVSKKVETVVKIKPRADRKPLNTPVKVNNFIEAWRKTYYPNLPSRLNSVFMTLDYYDAKDYGYPVACFLPKRQSKIFRLNNTSDSYVFGMQIENIMNPLFSLLSVHKDDIEYTNHQLKYAIEYMTRTDNYDLDTMQVFVNHYEDAKKLTIQNSRTQEKILSVLEVLEKKIETDYFDRFEEIKNPWDPLKYDELMIQCPYYYAVNEDWLTEDRFYD